MDIECEAMLSSQKLHDAVKQIGFDLALVDSFFGPCYFYLPDIHRIPYVTLAPEVDPIFGPSFALPSYKPNVLDDYSDNMTFVQRLKNFVLFVMSSNPRFHPLSVMRNESMFQKYRPHMSPNINSVQDLQAKALIIFLIRDYLLEWPIALMPNQIPVEGLTAYPAKPLNKEFSDLVSSANSGVVIVTFGSQIQYLRADITQKLFDAFGARKELFIMKLKRVADGVKIPQNVRVFSWMPQNDLLGHPNTKLFITHSGNFGQYEALYHGVPMLCAPLFAEQYHNAFRVVNHQYGLSFKFKDFTVQSLTDTIQELLANDRYKMSIEKASKILKSRPQNAREVAAYWIEHVLEFGGDHLRSAAIDMPWYQYYMLDVIMFLFTVLTIPSYVTLKVISKCFTSSTNIKVKTN